MYYIKAQLKSTPQLSSWHLPFPPCFFHIKLQFLFLHSTASLHQGKGLSHLHTSRSGIHLVLLSPELRWATRTAIFKSGGSKKILEQQWLSKMIFGKTISPFSNIMVSHHFWCSRLISRASERTSHKSKIRPLETRCLSTQISEIQRNRHMKQKAAVWISKFHISNENCCGPFLTV